MGNPSGQTAKTNLVATVGIAVDEATLTTASRQIAEALRKATEGIDLKALSAITENLKATGAGAVKVTVQTEQLTQAIQQTSRATADWRTQASVSYTNAQERLTALTIKQNALTTALGATTEAAKAAGAAIAPLQGKAQFSLGGLTGAAGSNLFDRLLSGQGTGQAFKGVFEDVRGGLFDIAKNAGDLSGAFSALGITGSGALTGITAGAAAAVLGLLALAPIAVQIGSAITDAFGKAYESQKEFVFQSGLSAKQLGLTAEEGAKIRSLLTLVGQENNVFASITLNQIQASIAALDRVDKGLEKPSQQVDKFGQALRDLGVSYKTQSGGLKDFTQVVVELSAALERLPASQRSLQIQNLAGLFGSDVAKIFGFGPEILTQVLQSATVVTKEAQEANDRYRESVVALTSAQNEFNIALTAGLTPLETFFYTFQAAALRQTADELNDFFARFGFAKINPEDSRTAGEQAGAAFAQGVTAGFSGGAAAPLLNAIFPDEATLQAKKTELTGYIREIQAGLKADPGNVGLLSTLQTYQRELADVENRLDAIRPKTEAALNPRVVDPGASVAIIKDRYNQLDDAIQVAIKAQKEVLDIQKQIEKQNNETTKSFNGQIDSLQSSARGYDQFFQKTADIYAKIGELRDKEGKPFTFVGAGGVKDLTKQLLDLQINEALYIERQAKADTDVKRLRLQKLGNTIASQRAALGLQPGEATILANVDITVGKSKLSKDDKAKLQEYLDELDKILKDFVKDSFDTVQSTLTEVLSGAVGNQQLYEALLRGGADTLQRYAEQVGLLGTPGFTQAIGEAALKAQLLAGAFGDLNDATQAPGAFDTYAEKLLGFRTDLASLTEFIADPKKLTIPLAIQFGLVTEGEATTVANAANINKRLKDALIEGGEFLAPEEIPGVVNEIAGRVQQTATVVAQQVDAQLAANGLLAAETNVNKTKSGSGIVDLLLAKYGIKTGEAIEATAEFAIDANVDTTLAKKKTDAEAEALRREEDARNINARWNLRVSFDNISLEQARQQIQDLLARLGNGVSAPPGLGTRPPAPTPSPNDNPSGLPGAGRADGGYVSGGSFSPFLERGQPEVLTRRGASPVLFMPPGQDGNVLGGASLLQSLLGQRLPAQPIINYSPQITQVQQFTATDPKAVAREVKRAQADTLFTTTSQALLSQDALRRRGLR